MGHFITGVVAMLILGSKEVSSMGNTRDWCNIISGVPQVSNIEPILSFSIITDVADCVSNNSGVAIFADDVTIYRNVHFLNGCLLIDTDLQALNDWISLGKP